MRLVVALVLLGLSCTAAVADTDEVCYVGTENIPPWEKEARMQRMLVDLYFRGEDYYASKWNQYDDLHREVMERFDALEKKRLEDARKLEASHKKMIASLDKITSMSPFERFLNYAKCFTLLLFILRVCLVLFRPIPLPKLFVLICSSLCLYLTLHGWPTAYVR